MNQPSERALPVLTPEAKSIGGPRALQHGNFPTRPLIHALYLHIPFCFHKCHYCDFYSLVETAGQPDRRHAALVDAFIAEIAHRHTQCRLEPTTIFAGGGTPTLLAPALWAKLLDSLGRGNTLENVEEFTVEANPETVTAALLDTLRAGGVNRLSIGAQSFNPATLKTLERWHEIENVARTVRLARAAGFDNLSLDLIFAVPGQSLDDVAADLDHALALEPEHLSYYNLTFEPGTALTKRRDLGQITPAEEAIEHDMYVMIIDRLAAAGFEHYEISNWAKRDDGGGRGRDVGFRGRDLRSRHNLAYWRNLNWLGIGPAAASHVQGRRWRNQPNLTAYLAGAGQPPVVDEEHLAADARAGERLMMGLRLLDGMAAADVDAAAPIGSPRNSELAYLLDAGMLERDADRIRLTRRGLFLADEVVGRLL